MLSTVRVGNFPISFISRVAIKHFPCSEFWTAAIFSNGPSINRIILVSTKS